MLSFSEPEIWEPKWLKWNSLIIVNTNLPILTWWYDKDDEMTRQKPHMSNLLALGIWLRQL